MLIKATFFIKSEILFISCSLLCKMSISDLIFLIKPSLMLLFLETKNIYLHFGWESETLDIWWNSSVSSGEKNNFLFLATYFYGSKLFVYYIWICYCKIKLKKQMKLQPTCNLFEFTQQSAFYLCVFYRRYPTDMTS